MGACVIRFLCDRVSSLNEDLECPNIGENDHEKMTTTVRFTSILLRYQSIFLEGIDVTVSSYPHKNDFLRLANLELIHKTNQGILDLWFQLVQMGKIEA